MIIKTFIEPPIDNNNYLLIDEESNDAVLIDCSSVDDNIKQVLKSYNANLKYILLTHGHFDHIAGIRNSADIKVLMHKADLEWVNNVNQFMPMFGMSDITIPKIDRYVEDGDEISFGTKKVKVIHTPGHTKGGVCYLVDNNLFSGDTIFRESVGRCDLEGGDFDEIVSSIENKIFTLNDDVIIYPGHGKSTTVGWEKQHNRFM